MKEKDKIFELFQRNSHKLSERPSSRAWDRLETRLDRHQMKRNNRTRNYLGMVAAILLLVVCVSVLGIMSQNQQDMDTAMAENASEGMVVLTDFTIEGEDVSKYERIVEFQRKYNYFVGASDLDREKGMRVYVNEGRKDKEFNPRNFNTNQRTAPSRVDIPENTMIAKAPRYFKVDESSVMEEVAIADLTSTSKKELTAKPTTSTSVERELNPTVLNVEPLDAVPSFGWKKDTEDAKAGNAKSLKEPADVVADLSVEEMGYKSNQEDDTYVIADSADGAGADIAIEETSPAAMEVSPTATYPSSTDPVDRFMRPEKKERSSVAPAFGFSEEAEEGYDMMKEKDNVKPTLDAFNWLVGSWNEKMKGGGFSVEQWTKIDEFTISGKGYVIQNKDTIFVEGMKIVKMEEDLFLMMSLNESQEPVLYKLKSYAGFSAVFENRNVTFPKQVVLEQTSGNSFNTILRNEGGGAKPSKEGYFNNRNQINRNRAVRNMVRMNN